MSWTFAQSGVNDNTGSGTSLAITLGGGTTAGSNLALWVKWEGGGDTTITADLDGQSFTAREKRIHSNGDLVGQFFSLFNANGGETVINVNWAAARSWRRIRVMEYTHSGGTPEFDDDVTAEIPSGTSLSSGNLTTTGTDELCFGAYGEGSGFTLTDILINGVAYDQLEDGAAGNLAAIWSKTFGATFTGAATATANSPAVMGLMAWKITAAGVTIEPGLGSLPFTGYAPDALVAMANDARIVIRKA